MPISIYPLPDCILDPIRARFVASKNLYRNLPIAIWRVLASFINIQAMFAQVPPAQMAKYLG